MQQSTTWRQSEAASHIVRFFMYNFIGALLPLVISWIMRRLGDVQAEAGAYAPEILFFGVMISATALGDLTDEEKLIGADWVLQILKGTLLFGALTVAAIFGMFQYDIVYNSGNNTVRGNITVFAQIASGTLFLASLSAEILIARIRGAAQKVRGN